MNKNCLANSCLGCAPRKDHLLLDDLPPETKGLAIRSSTNGCMADSGYTPSRRQRASGRGLESSSV